MQIAAELLAYRIIVLNFQQFSALVSSTYIDQYTAFARYVTPCVILVETLLDLFYLIVRDQFCVILQERLASLQQTPSVVLAFASLVLPTAKLFKTLQLLATYYAKALFAIAANQRMPLSATSQRHMLVPPTKPVVSETRAFSLSTGVKSQILSTRVSPRYFTRQFSFYILTQSRQICNTLPLLTSTTILNLR